MCSLNNKVKEHKLLYTILKLDTSLKSIKYGFLQVSLSLPIGLFTTSFKALYNKPFY